MGKTGSRPAAGNLIDSLPPPRPRPPPKDKAKRGPACSSTAKDHRCKELVFNIPNDLEPVLWRDCCIYNVPRHLRILNEEVYTPRLISIGPLHHGKKKLAGMEKQKLIYLKAFSVRTKMESEDILSNSKMDVERISHCYQKKSKLCINKYVKMILLDAVFIIELFLRFSEENEHRDDYMIHNLWLRNIIREDLVLLENQIPYFVLEDVFKSALPVDYRPTFYQLTCIYFNQYVPKNIAMRKEEKVLHFTDFVRYFLSSKHPKPKKSSDIKHLCSATKLHEAGVEFKGIEKKELTDISFEKGKLIMPQVEVNDRTELLIRNVMALEQCLYPNEAYICNYIHLMDFLINTAKDVDLLVEKGVIVNWLGSNEAVADMVNKLCTNTLQYNFCFHDICEDLNKHYKQRRHRAMKTLRSVYFVDIWRGTATVAAAILLVMTFLQTINSFWQLP